MPNTQSRRSQVNTSSVGLVTALATVWGAGIQIAMADDHVICTDPTSYAPIVIRNDYCSGKNSYFGRQYSDSQIWICNQSPLAVAPPGVTPTVYYQLGGICTQLANNGGWVRLDQVYDQTLYFNGSSVVLYAVLYDGTVPPANHPIPNPSCGAADYAYAMFEATTTQENNGILTVNWDLSNADQFSFPHHGTVLDSNRQEIQSAGFRGNLSASDVLGQVKTYYSAFQYYPSLQCPTDPLLAIGMADLVDPSWYSLSTNYQLPASLTSCDYTPRQGSPNCDDGASCSGPVLTRCTQAMRIIENGSPGGQGVNMNFFRWAASSKSQESSVPPVSSATPYPQVIQTYGNNYQVYLEYLYNAQNAAKSPVANGYYIDYTQSGGYSFVMRVVRTPVGPVANQMFGYGLVIDTIRIGNPSPGGDYLTNPNAGTAVTNATITIRCNWDVNPGGPEPMINTGAYSYLLYGAYTALLISTGSSAPQPAGPIGPANLPTYQGPLVELTNDNQTQDVASAMKSILGSAAAALTYGLIDGINWKPGDGIAGQNGTNWMWNNGNITAKNRLDYMFVAGAQLAHPALYSDFWARCLDQYFDYSATPHPAYLTPYNDRFNGMTPGLAYTSYDPTQTPPATSTVEWELGFWYIPADFNSDGAVNAKDLSMLLAAWGSCASPNEPCPTDVNADGQVDALDIGLVLAEWTG